MDVPFSNTKGDNRLGYKKFGKPCYIRVVLRLNFGEMMIPPGREHVFILSVNMLKSLHLGPYSYSVRTSNQSYTIIASLPQV